MTLTTDSVRNLDDKEYGWLKHSAAVEQLWHGTLLVLNVLAKSFLLKVGIDQLPDAPRRTRWQRRYEAAVERIRSVGIKTTKLVQRNTFLYAPNGIATFPPSPQVR